ncbi:MAG: ATP-binding protein [Clostridia bacterium]|nr:ATP-binding protein [Clostridia bacterium]
MTEQEKKGLSLELSSLSVFRQILDTDTLKALMGFLSNNCIEDKARLFGQFVFSLADDNYCFSQFLRRVVYSDENKYITATAKKTDIPKVLKENAIKELELFTRLTSLSSEMLWENIDYNGYKPDFQNEKIDFVASYEERLKSIDRFGYGIFATSKMFKVEDGEIIPVRSADTVSVDNFVGYEAERKQVFDNTKALVEGRPAANVLLFGDAGTGKSSTVKASANYYYDAGVRLIEIRKDQLFSLSYIMGRIADNPLKFIIFIDDLSFNKNDDCFSMLKAALEGSASAKASNAVIYATSNRRHIVKENFSDREVSDDVHHNDTVQELMSLSDRFGLTVYFERPNKSLYLDIVHILADKNGIKTDKKELDIKAEAFALQKGSRSPRAAEQFINSLI